MKKFFQKLGRSMLIAVVAMPLAGILLRLSADDLLNIPLLGAAGDAVFGNLDLLFAVGIALGFTDTKDKGIPTLVAVCGMLTLRSGLKIMNPDVNMGIFGGIITGLISAATYKRFRNTELPLVFSFFSGEKFPIIMVMVFQTIASLIFGYIWPYFQNGIDAFARLLSSMGAIGVGLFGFFNRLLIPTGLHHVLNTYIYFDLGEFTNAAGEIVKGEIPRFLAKDPTAGYFLSQFFVVMMFGIPGIAFAIYKAAYEDQKDEVKGLMTSGALTSFISGITEPIEFTFMFASPFLYILHALMMGLTGVITYLFDIRIGFSFGSSIVDYILNFKIATGAWKVIPLGLIVFMVYFLVFYNYIIKKDVKLVGRVDKDKDFSNQDVAEESKIHLKNKNYEYIAKILLKSFGGKDNIADSYNCYTRLRVTVKDPSLVDEQQIRNTGATGIYKPSDDQYQVVIGMEVSYISKEFDALLGKGEVNE